MSSATHPDERIDIIDTFESKVFNKHEMKSRLPSAIYSSLMKTVNSGSVLEEKIANEVASAMKDWAVENGATHYTHWFQPMTGITAEKHESFINFGSDGNPILEFSGKELIQGEPDASSFPTGGVRSTFEARGYTAWDPTSFAFIKDEVLCVPTAFCSYGGDSLDKKTPLLRSMQALSKQGERILELFGEKKTRLTVNVGAEQEYFLIDEDVYLERKDLIYTGRTLFGAPPSKGQELDDHYFGTIKPCVLDFMKELDEELWALGIASKTRHNEVAPAQHELAVVYETANRATDHNQLIMETLKNVAARHGLTCILHEKPFARVNGSGKHCNWSLATSSGDNLLNPGKTPKDNARFLLFLAAVIKAIDEHQDLMRISIATAGNDHRLGVAEAPPAIISIFLGEELTDIIEAIKAGKASKNKGKSKINIGASVLPDLPKDTTDRNRTSPFAFTGNKFEFRMVGSSDSISAPLFVLNTIVADTLASFADKLAKAKDFDKALAALIKETFKKHERIIFNGNNYAKEWVDEAKKRKLLNLPRIVDALPLFSSKKNLGLFERQNVLSNVELKAREELLLDTYWKLIKIEALTMRNLTRKEFMPTASDYAKQVVETLKLKKEAEKNLGVKNSGKILEENILAKLGPLTADLYKHIIALEKAITDEPETALPPAMANYYADKVLPAMNRLRGTVDALELVVAKEYWPLPSYGEILYSVR
jgi:glutamine synthetase